MECTSIINSILPHHKKDAAARAACLAHRSNAKATLVVTLSAFIHSLLGQSTQSFVPSRAFQPEIGTSKDFQYIGSRYAHNYTSARSGRPCESAGLEPDPKSAECQRPASGRGDGGRQTPAGQRRLVGLQPRRLHGSASSRD